MLVRFLSVSTSLWSMVFGGTGENPSEKQTVLNADCLLFRAGENVYVIPVIMDWFWRSFVSFSSLFELTTSAKLFIPIPLLFPVTGDSLAYFVCLVEV